MGLEGKQVSGYRIGPQLGSGGMGTVHRAETLADGPVGPAGTTVAVKFFHQHLVEDERAFRRFEQEAEIGKNIRHSNVVRTYELGKDDVDGETWHFIVMEFIEGQTLRDLVEDLGTLPEHLILQIADQTLDALSAIHAQDIVHRDIKPENLVITSEHRVLLMDLGIARQTDRTTQLTQSGEFLGSIPYAAPEQIFEQDKVGPRSDLYAFGVALYEMATGERPFPETDLSALLALKMEGNFRRPRVANPDIERFLDEVIVTCLEKEPAARFSSCAELRTILQEGEQSVWWRERTSGREAPVAERALKRLRVARDTPMVGRGRQLDRLHELYKEVLGGAGCTLFVSGPAGSGKSRLVYSFLEEVAASQGPVILGGRNIGSGGRAYQPFVEVVHDLLGVDDFDAGERLEKVQELLRGMLPDTPGVIAPLAEFLLGGLQPGMESGFSKDALVAGFAGLLHPISEARPVVIVIEDLHLAGPETLEMFGYLARTVGTHRVFLIGLYRDDEVQDGSPLHRLMGELASRDEVRALTLEALPRSATDELIRSLVRHERTVRRLGRLAHEKSDGNPLIILEM
ncbi:MAG: serine/threonine-protein kinase PknK, partial [Planctomycetota bacterium]